MIPADVSWTEVDDGAGPTPTRVAVRPRAVASDVAEDVAKALRSGEPAVVLLGGGATRRAGLMAAGRVAATTGAKLLGETFPARLERGAGLPALERLGYLAEFTQAQLAGARHLVLVGAVAPVSFFAYPDIPGYLVPDGCQVYVCWPPSARTPWGFFWKRWPTWRTRRRGRAPVGLPTGTSDRCPHGRVGRQRNRGPAAEGAIVSDEQCRGSSSPAPLLQPGARLALFTGGAIGQGCRWPRERRWPVPVGRCCRSKPTGVRCTRSSRCGPRPGRISTSPPWSSTTAPTPSWRWS